MKKFNEYIYESDDMDGYIPTLNKRGSSEITSSKFNQLLNYKCKEYIKNENTKIYRGQPNMGDFIYFDPMKGDKRRSIEKENIHVDLIDSLPSWDKYPDYSMSVIGLTDNPNGARGYSDDQTIYEMIPFDDSPIVICPSDNIWSSFSSEGWGSDIHFIGKIFSELFDLSESISKNLNDLKNLQPNIYSIITDNHLMDKIISFMERDSHDYFYKPCHGDWKNKDIKELKGKDIYDYINGCLFSPEVRGFTLKQYNNFKSHTYRQVWTSGPVIMKRINKNEISKK